MITESTPEDFKQPVLQYHGNNEFLLIIDYIFTWESNGIQKRLNIPAGFSYDKASVPRRLGPLLGFNRDGEHEAAALVHDRLYLFKGRLPRGEFQTFVIGSGWVDDPSPWTRAQADEMLRYMSVLGGMPKWKASVEKWACKLWPGNYFKF